MTQSVLEVRPAVAEDLVRIVSLAATRLPLLGRDLAFAERYFRWKYFDLAGRDTGYPSGFVAEDAQGISGFLGCLPFTLQVDGWCAAGGWIADWSLATRARGKGIGRALLATARDMIPALACVEGTPEAQALFRAEGFQSWESGRSWLWIDRPVAYEWPRRSGFRRILGLVRATEHVTRRLSKASLLATAGRLETLESRWDEVGERFDLTGAESGARRTAGYLQWLGRSPAADTRVHRLSGGGTDIGVALTHRDRDVLGRQRARILELVVAGPRAMLADAYAAVARALVRNDHADYIDLVAPIGHDAALRAAGFTPRSTRRLWLRRSEPHAFATPSWRLTLVDKDDAFRSSWRVP
jgi:GNAT superfamily N-acetyltransferase